MSDSRWWRSSSAAVNKGGFDLQCRSVHGQLFREIVMVSNETMKPNRSGFLQDAGAASASFDLGVPFATRATPRAARLK
jgi:hypothetical protein